MQGRPGGGRARAGAAGVVALVLLVLVAGLAVPAAGAVGAAAPKRLRCEGPATARSQTRLTPIAKRPKPALPVIYTDVTGRPVTISDTRRILAVDSYGTLASTVY